MTGGLLAVHAHPDDETLATGGLLATWAASGRPVTVVTCTRGELGEVILPELVHLEGNGPALAHHREGELADALAALGASGFFLDQVDAGPGLAAGLARYCDSGMEWAGVGQAALAGKLPAGAFVAAPIDEAARRLAVVIRDRRPEVVVTYEPGGGYGHPDHIRAHEVTMRAVVLAASASSQVPGTPHAVGAVLWTAVGELALRSAYSELALMHHAAGVAPRSLELPDPAGPLPSVAVLDARIDVSVDVAPVLGRVVGALRAYRTQVQAVSLREEVRSDGPTPPAAALTGTTHPAATLPNVAVTEVLGSFALSNDLLVPLTRRESYRFAPGYAGALACWPTGVTPVA